VLRQHLLRLEASFTGCFDTYAACRLFEMSFAVTDRQQLSKQWSNAIASYVHPATALHDQVSGQLVLDAIALLPYTHPVQCYPDVTRGTPVEIHLLENFCAHIMKHADQQKAALSKRKADATFPTAQTEDIAASVEADVRSLLDMVAGDRHRRQYPAKELQLPQANAPRVQGAPCASPALLIGAVYCRGLPASVCGTIPVYVLLPYSLPVHLFSCDT